MPAPFITIPVCLVLGLIIAIFMLRDMVSRYQTKLRVIDQPSGNFDSRNGNAVSVLVLHYTAMGSAQSAIDWLCNPQSKVSSHYVIDEQGGIYRLVNEENRAWHAGVSSWCGRSDINSVSVGIEIANDGEQPYPQAQMDAVIDLCKDIVSRHNILPHNVIGHSDVAPSRKQDPGAHFGWQKLAQVGLGVWPNPEKQDYDRSASWTENDFADALQRYGYTDGSDFAVRLTAFQRHFQPEVFFDSDKTKIGIRNPEAAARLACLLRITGR